MKYAIAFAFLLMGSTAFAGVDVFPSSVNFYSVRIGGIGQSASVNVYNTGNEPVTVRLNDYCYGDFNTMNWCYSALQPGQSCHIEIRFKPYRVGYQNCSIFVHDGNFAGKSVSISGQGVE